MKAAEDSIIKIAAQLLTFQISDNPEDWPKRFRRSDLRLIEAHNDRQRNWSASLKKCHDDLQSQLTAAQDENKVLKAKLAKAIYKIELMDRYLNEGSMIKSDFIQLIGDYKTELNAITLESLK